MAHLNVEIKAWCANPDAVRETLIGQGAHFIGKDRQTDSYFRVPNGRLKLREGQIENALIHYSRIDQAGPKTSEVSLYSPSSGPALKTLLTHALGILVVVDKQREIYFIDNVKFHIDSVTGLGNFVEIEAIDLAGNLGQTFLEKQCARYLDLLAINPADLLTHSYSDMLLQP